LGSDDRENQVRLEGWGRGVVLNKASSKQQQQHDREAHEQDQMCFSASSSKTSRVAVPPLPIFQRNQLPTYLSASSIFNDNFNYHTSSHTHDDIPFSTSTNIVLPDPIDLTANCTSSALDSANFSDERSATHSIPDPAFVLPRHITLPSPLCSAAPTPRDHLADDARTISYHLRMTIFRCLLLQLLKLPST
jgi:hypothetical protein